MWGQGKLTTATLSPPERFCIKMGSEEDHYVSLIARGKSQGTIHKSQLLKRGKSLDMESNRRRPSYQPDTLVLGQTGSLCQISAHTCTVPCPPPRPQSPTCPLPSNPKASTEGGRKVLTTTSETLGFYLLVSGDSHLARCLCSALREL